MELSQHPLKQLLEGLVEQFKWNNSKLTLSTSENVIRALAKRASLPAGKKLSNLEIESLLTQLFTASNTLYAPDRRKICVLLSQAILEDFLK